MDYLIEEIQEFKGIRKEATYLVLFHVDKQPPHLGLIVNGRYFSLRFDKVQKNIDPKVIFKTVENKKIQTIIFEIQDSNENSVANIFDSYSNIEGISCLYPLRSYFFPNDFKDIVLIFDLLDKLKLNQHIIATYSLNLSENNGTYKLKSYSFQDVQNEIKRLKK